MLSLKKYVLNLNLYEQSVDINDQEDDERRRLNIIATRVYLVILLLILFEIGFVLSLSAQTTTIIVKYPTKEQFQDLPIDAQCSCSRISLTYGTFTSLQSRFHQVCSSDFVSDRWFDAISSGSNSSYFSARDFRTSGSAQFQALAGLCRLSKASIEQSIAFFYLSTLLSPQVLSETVLRSKTHASINQFQSTAPNTFRAQLRLVNEMTVNNRFISGLQTSAFHRYYIYSDQINMWITDVSYKQKDGSYCYCDFEVYCTSISVIENIFGASTSLVYGNIKWTIPGILSGCLPVHSILESTLECLYDQICLNRLISYFPTNNLFTAMPPIGQSLYSKNSTVKSMVNNLMIEDWTMNISYDKYYSQCAPSSCTYSKISRHTFIFILTKLIGVLGSLTIVLRLLIPLIIRFIQRVRSTVPRPRVSFCIRLHQFKDKFGKKAVESNIFSYYPSTDRQIRYQRYATRLYILLIFIILEMFTVYILSERSIQSINIFNPTESEYIQLEQKYSHSLSCACSSISMSYKTFIKIDPYYHQLCSSDLISDRWIIYIYLRQDTDLVLLSTDYRSQAPRYFQSLSMFCQQAQQTITDTLEVFLQSQYIRAQVISQESFKFGINLLIENWKSTILNTFQRTIQLVRATSQGNQLSTGTLNIAYSINSITRQTIMTTSTIFSNCLCALNSSCHMNMNIYDLDPDSYQFIKLYSIPNLFSGCFPIEALFASTLECFYNLSCMLKIDSLLSSKTIFNFSALNTSLNRPNETIESIVNRLMVDRWSSNISFSSYYNKCAPFSCTYEYEYHNNLFSVITTIASILGGLSLGVKIILLFGLQFVENIMTNGFGWQILLRSIKHIFTCNTKNEITHRLHIFLVIITLYTLYFFSVFNPHITTVTVNSPTLSVYQDFVLKYPDSFQCSCSQISIKYKSFVNIVPRFHQICSSDLISNQWIKYRYGASSPVRRFSPNDFYYSASGQFQLLASFCRLAQETVNNSLLELGANDFINTQLLSSSLLADRIQTTLNEFQLTIPNLFVNTLKLIRETTGANMLISVWSTSWLIAIPPSITSEWAVHTVPLEYQGCNCALSSKCVSPSRGMLAGCYPLEAILQSAVECLYNQQCIDSTNSFKAINISSLISTRFSINTTIESIVNDLMIEKFLSNMSYQLYFDQCAPISCTYSYVNKNNLIEGITTMIGLYGGLLIICRLLAIFIVKHLLCISQRVNPIADQ